MAESPGTQAQLLMSQLYQEPYGMDFRAAVRRLESLHPDKPRIGTSDHVADDPVRFGQDPSLAFAPAEISSVTPRPDGPPRIAVAFFGLLGPNGPLPLHLTAYVRERLMSFKDSALVRFLDVLVHRFISLFYRSWVVNQKAVSYDRPNTDRWMVYFSSLTGLGQLSLRNRDRVDDNAKLYYVGRLAAQTRSAAGLGDVLADYFGVPARVHECMGQWVMLPGDCCCRLGQSPATGLLGRTLVVGRHMWDCQMKFRVSLGPMRFRDFQRFLPGAHSLHRLHDWIEFYTSKELEWEAQLILRKEDVPGLLLGRSGRLGWTTWIGSQAHCRDADEVVLASTVAA